MAHSCYCYRIKQCKADIKTIEYILEKLKNVDLINHDTLTYVKDVSDILGDLSTPDNLYDIQSGILKSNNKIEGCIYTIIDVCKLKLNQLKRELSYIEISDSNYHSTLSLNQEINKKG